VNVRVLSVGMNQVNVAPEQGSENNECKRGISVGAKHATVALRMFNLDSFVRDLGLGKDFE